MVTREPYDQERVVRHSETHDEPTAVIRRDAVVHEHPHGHAHHTDEVVVERPAPVAYHGDAIREDVSIDHVVARRAMLDRVSSIVWFFSGLIMAAIGLRVIFRLLAANEASGFVQFIYGFTEPFVRPFQGIFAEPAANGAALDSAALFALLMVALVTWGLVRLMWLIFDKPETGARRSVSEMHHDRL
jgi:uncharacterized protein YggT (Ycf19 family)